MTGLLQIAEDAAERIVARWNEQTNTPLVPVIVGRGSAIRTPLSQAAHRPVVVLSNPDVNAAFRSWCSILVDSGILRTATVAYLAERTRTSTRRLMNDLTDANRFRVEQLLRSTHVDSDSHRQAVIRLVCDSIRSHRVLSAEALVQLTDSEIDRSDDCPPELMRAIADLVGPERCPVLLCVCTTIEQAQPILQMALRCSVLRVGFVFSRTSYQSLRMAKDSFVKAVLQDAVYEIDTPVDQSYQPTAGEPHSAAAELTPSDALSDLIVRDGLEEQAQAVEQACQSVASRADADRARSASEAFLFRALNAHPRTHGLFSLNETTDFDFGPRPAEIDLLCRQLKLAIEIDGYFHFVDEEGYRRDRRKDVLLQQHGYFVLRFLAADVVPELQEIVDTIIATVDWRQRERCEPVVSAMSDALTASSPSQQRKPR